VTPRLRRRAVLGGVLLILLVAGGSLGGRRLLFEHHLRAAREALDDQDCDEARPHLVACLRLGPDNVGAHFAAARGLRRAGFYDEADEHLRECQRITGETPDVLLEWAMLGAARGDLPENEPFLQARLDEGSLEGGLILEALAQGSIHVYHLGRARHYLEQLLAREPDNVLGLMWQGWQYETSGRAADALANYRRAVRLRPRQPQVRLRLAQLALRQGELAEAEEHLGELGRRGYKRPEVLLALAQCRAQIGDPARACELLDELLAESPDDSGALVERGKLALADGEPERAERLLRRAVGLTPQDRQALNFLAQALSQQGKASEAAEYAARLEAIEAEMKRLEEVYKKMSQSPNDAGLRHEAGLICLRNGQDAEALRWLTGALQLDPAYAPAHEALARYYDRTGQPALAARHRQLAAPAGAK
jgi:predicted Zn-dependent protease